MNGATSPIALSTSGSSRRDRMNVDDQPEQQPDHRPACRGQHERAQSLGPADRGADRGGQRDLVHSQRGGIVEQALPAEQSHHLTRQAEAAAHRHRRRSHPGGATIAPSVNAAAGVSSGTVWYATNPTANVVASGSPTASSAIGRKLLRSAT